jgi:hypothetical protein
MEGWLAHVRFVGVQISIAINGTEVDLTSQRALALSLLSRAFYSVGWVGHQRDFILPEQTIVGANVPLDCPVDGGFQVNIFGFLVHAGDEAGSIEPHELIGDWVSDLLQEWVLLVLATSQLCEK